MNIGVSSACLYPTTTEQSINKLIKTGFRNFEIFINSSSELENEFIENIKSTLAATNSKVVSIHPYISGFEPCLFFSDYYRRFEDSIKIYEKFLEAAKIYGAKYIVMHGDRIRDPILIPDKEYFERFKILSNLASKYSVTIVQENVNLFRSSDPCFIKDMKNYLKNDVKFVLDIKQCIRSGYSPFDILNAMENNIALVHISDNNIKNDCIPPGQGNFDFLKLKNLLLKNKYQGDVIIELYNSGFKNLDELWNSYLYLKKLFDA